MKTIEKKFNITDLPEWAQKNHSVVYGCIEDYTFRCNICSAETTQQRKRLSLLAEEKWGEQADDWYFHGDGWDIVKH